MTDQARINALKREVQSATRQGKPSMAYQSLKARHQAGKIQLTYDDLVWLGYFLGYKYAWATVKAFELGIFTHQIPVIVPCITKGTEKS